MGYRIVSGTGVIRATTVSIHLAGGSIATVVEFVCCRRREYYFVDEGVLLLVCPTSFAKLELYFISVEGVHISALILLLLQ
jgi:hypothetical protein